MKMKMTKKKLRVGTSSRAWNLLRLALLWARKSSMLKRRLMMDLRLLPKYLKNLRQSTTTSSLDRTSSGAIHYRERQLSFDETPIIHLKMHRPSSIRFRFPRIPCLNQDVLDFDYEFGEEDDENDIVIPNYRKNFLEVTGDHEDVNDCEMCEETASYGDDDDDNDDEDEGIDLKAEQFIANFYEQMKLQRQFSYSQRNQKMANTRLI